MSEQEKFSDDQSRIEPGTALAQERARRGMSLEQAAGSLRLTTTTLNNIEQGRFDAFAPAYLRGYVANYARLLELDPEPLLRSLEFHEPEPLRSVLPVHPAGQRMERFVRFATYGLVTTLIVPPLVYFFVQGGASLLEGDLPVREQVAVTGPAAAPAEGSSGPRPGAAVDGSPARQDVAESSHLSASALLLPTMRRPQEPVEQLASQVQPEADAVEVDPRSVLELTLEEDCWVEIESADGQRLEFDLLRGGQQHRYTGMAPFRLLLGRGNVVRLAVNGELVTDEQLNHAGVVQLEIGMPRAVMVGEG